ncbi:hypothetical protein GRI94_15645 [Erythrobacter jejuensis]|uniref:Uncharacterized protein n=1 Tax=Parerythrobacter jejuensis TaxID=795812 RepID=A0A845ANS1_9SPHN|nr:hypothetical protein [Parerythrobacter jejuensis]MXP33261.1 hypothetical protein [Parerythrobacter jejuensis]
MEACNWQEPGGLPEVNRMVDFIEGLGIEVFVDTVPDAEEMGMTIRKGAIIIDPAAPVYPGDLLHEAGHLAVADPQQRATMEQMSDDPGEEMAAIAWSAAATVPCEITLEVLFHDMGYKGHAASLRMNFSQGNFLGVPMLAMWDMTAELHRPTPDMPAYPRMTRWLRGGDPVA